MPDFATIIRTNRPDIKDTTLKKYVLCLNIIERDIFQNRWNDKFFNDTETVIDMLKEKYPNVGTLNSYASALIVYLKSVSGIKESTLEKYKGLLTFTNESVKEKYLNQERSQKEDDNWMTMADIKDLRDQKYQKFSKETRKRQKVDYFQQYLVLCLYTKLPPVRNDYANVRVVDKDQVWSKDTNYVHVAKKKVIFCQYKTDKSYGMREYDLPDDIVQDITRFMELRGPLAHDYLLVNINDLTKMTKNGLTQYMKKIFHPKKISSSMLRKIYLSEKYPVVHTYKEAEFDSQFMGHSLKTQQSIYRKKVQT